MENSTLPPQTTVPAIDGSDRALAILCHLSFFLGMGFLLPLIVYLAKRKDSPFVEFHSREVLNFHISLVLYCVCAIPLMLILIGFPILVALAIMAIVCAIIGALKASDNGFYHYPLTIRFLS